MRCPNCGADVPEGDVFCGNCGHRMAPTQPQPELLLRTPPQPRPQPTPVSPIHAPPPAAPPVAARVEEQKRSAVPWIIAAVVVVGLCLLCGAGGAGYYFFMRPTPTPTWTPTFTPSPVPTATATAMPTATTVAIATPMPVTVAAPTPAWVTETYVDPYAGLRVAYPAGWVIAEQTAGDSATIVESEDVYLDPAKGVWITLMVQPGVSSLAEYESSFVAELESEGLAIAGPDPESLAGLMASSYLLRGTISDASAPIQARAYVVVNQGVGIALVYGTAQNAWEETWPRLEALAQQVSFVPPVVQATPTAAPEPEITDIVCAQNIDDADNPVGITDTFLPGTTEVYCFFNYQGFAGITEYRAVFLRYEGPDTEATLELPGDDSGQAWLRRYNDEGLWPGDYLLDIYVGEEWLASTWFTVQGEVLLEDDFSDAGSGWSTWSSDTSEVAYVDGELRIHVKAENWTAYATYGELPDAALGDFAVEADVWLTEIPEKGGEVGIVARREDKDYYQFVLGHNGYYKIRKHTDEGWEILVDWTETDAAYTGTDAINRLRVECHGSTMRVFVNGYYLDQIEDDSFISGQVGLMAGSYTDGPNVRAAFDDVVIYRFP